MELPETRERFVSTFTEVSAQMARGAEERGFRLKDFPTFVALAHSELSEALEEDRRDPPVQSEKIPEFSAIEEELADVVIRIMEYSARMGYRLPEAIIAKHDYNGTRKPKHGKRY